MLIECPAVFYDAPLGIDCILSYEWLAKNGIDVRCRRHGLEVVRSTGLMWIPGIVHLPLTPAHVKMLLFMRTAAYGVPPTLGRRALGWPTPYGGRTFMR